MASMSCSYIVKSSGKRFKWSNDHDVLLLREVLSVDIWSTRPGSLERGEYWKKIADNLNNIDILHFEVTVRSVRERFRALFDKRKAKLVEEERASGIAQEPTEAEQMLDEIIELVESSNKDRLEENKEKKKKACEDAAKAPEMHRRSLETLGETRKRKEGGEGSGVKKQRCQSTDTFEFLKDKLSLDKECKEKKLALKERELEVSTDMQNDKSKCKLLHEEISAQMLEVQSQVDAVNRKLDVIAAKQKEHGELLLAIYRHLSAYQ